MSCGIICEPNPQNSPKVLKKVCNLSFLTCLLEQKILDSATMKESLVLWLEEVPLNAGMMGSKVRP